VPTKMLVEDCAACGGRGQGYADLLVGLRRGPARVSAVARRLDPRLAPAPGEWTVGEVLGHLVDAELIWGFRLRLILSGDEPDLPPVPAEVWPQRFAYAGRDPRKTLVLLRALRHADVDMLEAVPRGDWEKVGRHPVLGRISARQIAAHLGHHELQHLRDFAALQTPV
jgi:hypothetical protein